jgi:hypothetical protein
MYVYVYVYVLGVKACVCVYIYAYVHVCVEIHLCDFQHVYECECCMHVLTLVMKSSNIQKHTTAAE